MAHFKDLIKTYCYCLDSAVDFYYFGWLFVFLLSVSMQRFNFNMCVCVCPPGGADHLPDDVV